MYPPVPPPVPDADRIAQLEAENEALRSAQAPVPPGLAPADPVPAPVPAPGSIRFHAVQDNFGQDVVRTVLVVGEDLLGHALGLVLGHAGDAVPFVAADLLTAPPAPAPEAQT